MIELYANFEAVAYAIDLIEVESDYGTQKNKAQKILTTTIEGVREELICEY